MDHTGQQVETIREVFRYSRVFRGSTFVLQLDDSPVESPAFGAMIRDLVLLHQNGIKIVLVAGARGRIDEVLTRYGVETERYRGVRISSENALPFIKMAAFDMANRIMTPLSGHGVNATHIMGEIMAEAIGGTMEKFDLFAGMKHFRIPGSQWLGNQIIALGMLYYKLMDRL